MSWRVSFADCPNDTTESPAGFDVEAGETVLQAGLRHHLPLPFGCQSGGCASCRVRLRSGEIDYLRAPPALSAAEIESGYILMCLARPRSDLCIELHQPAEVERLRPRQLAVKVIERRWLAHDVIGLTLKLPRGSGLHYLPGQYLDILLDDGRRRSFSIANAPNGETLELHIRLAPDGQFAHWAAHEMPLRTLLSIQAPLGAFYLREDLRRPALMVAGGTGIAPLRAMLQSPSQPDHAHLYWGVRAQRDLYLDEELRAWAAESAGRRYTPVLSEPDADWKGERGWVHEAVLRVHPDLHGHAAYLSGPPAMVRTGKDSFIEAGLDADHLFYDAFDYAFQTWPQLG